MNYQPDKNSREYLENQFHSGRMNLLMMISFTVTNIVLLLAESGLYFLFSATIPYFLAALGAEMDMQLGGSTYVTTAVVVCAVILGVYLLLWFLSKKRPGMLYVAFGLFALDTVALLAMALLAGGLVEEIVNIIFHGWVLFSLFQGARCGGKLKNMPEATPITGADYTGTSPELDM
jgi:hypothetical protein